MTHKLKLQNLKIKISNNTTYVIAFLLLFMATAIMIIGFYVYLGNYLDGTSRFGSNNFVDTTVIYFSILSVIVILLFLFSIFVLSSSKNDKKMMLEQQESNRVLSQEAEIANKANKAKSKFLSHMSHDIRTPINGIIGMTNIALSNIDNKDKVEECLQKIDVASSHLLSLINDILDMSRIENGKVTISTEPLDIHYILDECTAIIEGHLENRNIKFITEVGSFSYPYFKGDELHLLQILINILGNAVKFTPDGGKIYFRVKEGKKRDNIINYRFEVEDTGIGMKQEYLAHIWDPFSQEDNTSRSEYKGTGLGLAITKQLVTLLDGDITVESQEQVGSKFTVKLPFEITEESTVPLAQNDNINLKGFKILLVEDNELSKEIEKDILENHGAIITEADNGEEAVNIFCSSRVNRFDLILMDVMMPIMDGLTATKTIRALERADAKNIPIIAMTANAYEEDIEMTLKAGMNAHLSKPIEINKFLKTIDKFRTERKSQHKLTFAKK